MEIHQVRIKYTSKKDVFKLYPLGDVHCGAVQCAEDAIKAKVKQIQEDPFALWVGMGDQADLIVPHDPRWDVMQIAPWVEQTNIAESQRKWVVKLYEPIKDKCIGMCSGNHEDSIRIYNTQDIHLDICRDLGVKNLGYSAFVRLFFARGKEVYAIDCHFEHGAGGAQTDGGKIMRLNIGMNAFDADIYAMGHLHDKKVNSITRLHLTENFQIKQKTRVGAITGSWYKAYIESPYPSYAEKKGYRPTELGCPVFYIYPNKRRVSVALE